MRFFFLLQVLLITLGFAAKGQPNQEAGATVEEEVLYKELGTKKRIVGVGESTHGTKEFTIRRTELVKVLVTQFGFRALVLEADFVPCSRINEYLSTGTGNIEKLMLELRLWPWIHVDFLALLNWLKDYNQQNPDKQVLFYGMDSQYFRLFSNRDSILNQYGELGKRLFELAEGPENPREKIKALRQFSDEFSKAGAAGNDLRFHYFIFGQINKLSQSVNQNQNIRDENLAAMVKRIQKHNGDSLKMILWAHNSHISKQGPSINERTAMGYHLLKQYGDDYAAVGQDFKEGQFMAVDYESVGERKVQLFQLQPTKSTMASGIDFQSSDYRIYRCCNLQADYFMNAIGAIYVKKPGKKNSFYSKIDMDNKFDYLIISKQSSPIDLLPAYPYK